MHSLIRMIYWGGGCRLATAKFWGPLVFIILSVTGQ